MKKLIAALSVLGFACQPVEAQTVIKSPRNLTCRELTELVKEDPALPGLLNENRLKLNAYYGWGVGYIQGRDPKFFPALVKYSGETVTPDAEFGFYLGYVSMIFNGQCKKMSSMRLEELANIMIEKLPATFK